MTALMISVPSSLQAKGRKNLKKILLASERAEQNLPKAWPETGGEYHQNERVERVRNAVLQLPPIPRMIVSLYYLEGFSCSEISALLEKPVNTIKTHLARARQELKKLLAVYELD